MEKLSNFFRRILFNNKALAVVCFIAAFIIWLIVAVELSPETTVVINDVPVTVDYSAIKSNLGLSPFGEQETSVNVSVTGRRLVVESDDFKNKIAVTADTSSVTGAGIYSLRLDAGVTDSGDAVTINSLSKSSVTVCFDYEAREEFTVEPIIMNEGEFYPVGYVAGDAYVSNKKVTVVGPESEINKITGLTAQVFIDGEVTQTQVVNTDISVVSNSAVNFSYVTMYKATGSAEISNVDVTVPIYKIVTLETGVGFTGKPSAYSDSASFGYSVSPSSVTLGIPESRVESMTNLIVKKIDFTSLKPGKNSFEIDVSEVENTGCLVLDGTEKFNIEVNVENVALKVLEAPAELACINVPDGVTVKSVTAEFTGVTVAGTEEALRNISLDDTDFGADLSELKEDAAGEVTVPVVFTDDNCWAVGEYTAVVVIA